MKFAFLYFIPCFYLFISFWYGVSSSESILNWSPILTYLRKRDSSCSFARSSIPGNSFKYTYSAFWRILPWIVSIDISLWADFVKAWLVWSLIWSPRCEASGFETIRSFIKMLLQFCTRKKIVLEFTRINKEDHKCKALEARPTYKYPSFEKSAHLALCIPRHRYRIISF